jgi:prepilin-type N-terminal cleavage/methylation domain-containing protein/prepilin-type processing-associated H-X9-DG protein
LNYSNGRTTVNYGYSRNANAFTLIELLVVIAIIAILAAILFPVFAQAREKARQTTCLSNEKQISVAILQYEQDYDENYPQSVDGSYQYWENAVQPYIKNGDTYQGEAYGRGGVWNCPSWPDDYGQGQKYGASDGLFVSNYGVSPGQARSSWSNAVIDAPADKILIVEKGRNGASWGYETFLTLQGWWATSVLTNGVYDPNKDNSSISIQPGYDRDLSPSSPNPTAWEGPRTIRYRHNGVANVIFADGHAKGMTRGSIKWYQNVYIPTVYQANVAQQYSWAPSNPY